MPFDDATTGQLIPAALTTWGAVVVCWAYSNPGDHEPVLRRERRARFVTAMLFLYALYLTGLLIARANGIA